MAIYWIDSGVLISAKNGLYSPDLVPKFWSFLEEQLKSGAIRMPKMAYDEITDGNDDLAKWCKARKNVGFFCVRADRQAQERFSEVANHVCASHKPHAAADFLKGADGWVIAHALATGGYVVTEELRNSYRSKVKIPIVCKALRAPWKATHEMCKELEAKF
ncbi:MAG TPA: DUF4411 family protein [Vicinamibacterales bacterium]